MNQPLIPLPMLVATQAAAHGSETILRSKERGIWKSVTWTQLDAKVSAIGRALIAADFACGDVVAILSETRPEVVYADLAILGCGAASVAIDPEDDPDRVGHQLSSSGARLAFVENDEQLDKVLTIRDRCPGLGRIVVFDMKGLRDFSDASCTSLADFIETGQGADWATRVKATASDQPAVIQFPRAEAPGLGRTLTHGDLIHMVSTARSRLPIRSHDERLAMLRLSDITERVLGLYLALDTRCISNYPEGTDTVIENLQELQPTILGADATVWDHLHALANSQARAATRTQRMAYTWALRAARVGGAGGRLADLLVLRAVRKKFGLNRLRLAYVGGTEVSPLVLDWARSLGIAIRRVDEAASGAEQHDERYQALLHNAYA